MSATIHLKIDINNSFRRVEIPLSFTFAQLQALLLEYTSSPQQAITIQYQDEEDDWISLLSEADWSEAKTIVLQANTSILRIKVYPSNQQESDRKCCWRKWQEGNQAGNGGCCFKRAFCCRRQCKESATNNQEQAKQSSTNQTNPSVPSASTNDYEQIDEEIDEVESLLYPRIEVPSETIPYENALHTLQQMGFTDHQRNMELLQRFHGNINSVIQLLLSN